MKGLAYLVRPQSEHRSIPDIDQRGEVATKKTESWRDSTMQREKKPELIPMNLSLSNSPPRTSRPVRQMSCGLVRHFIQWQGSVAMKTDLLKRITIEPGKCGGRPCIRGMRIRVTDVLQLLSAGAPYEEILEDYPDLERDDILASIEYAAHQTDHMVLQRM